MVWIGFISICCSKVAKEGKSCPRLLVLQRVAQNAKSCSKVAEHNLFMPSPKWGESFDFQPEFPVSHRAWVSLGDLQPRPTQSPGDEVGVRVTGRLGDLRALIC